MIFQIKVEQFYSAILALQMNEYLDMVEYFGFGYATSDRSEIQECIPPWDMALELVDRGYRVSDLYNEGYKYIPQYCPLG
jgi:hypothetical protein